MHALFALYLGVCCRMMSMARPNGKSCMFLCKSLQGDVHRAATNPYEDAIEEIEMPDLAHRAREDQRQPKPHPPCTTLGACRTYPPPARPRRQRRKPVGRTYLQIAPMFQTVPAQTGMLAVDGASQTLAVEQSLRGLARTDLTTWGRLTIREMRRDGGRR
jgi:hypothetical protein